MRYSEYVGNIDHYLHAQERRVKGVKDRLSIMGPYLAHLGGNVVEIKLGNLTGTPLVLGRARVTRKRNKGRRPKGIV